MSSPHCCPASEPSSPFHAVQSPKEEEFNPFSDWKETRRAVITRVHSLDEWTQVAASDLMVGRSKEGGPEVMEADDEALALSGLAQRLPSFSPWATDTNAAVDAAVIRSGFQRLADGASLQGADPGEGTAASPVEAASFTGMLRSFLSRGSNLPRILTRAESVRLQARLLPAPPTLGPVQLGPELTPFSSPESLPLACGVFPELSDVLHQRAEIVAVQPGMGGNTAMTSPRSIHVVFPRGEADSGRGSYDASDSRGGSGTESLECSHRGGSWAAAALLSASGGDLTSDVGLAMDAFWSGECEANSNTALEEASP